ncbi:MAG: signal peptidase I [Clostridiales bacterium]|nr:signal peptidase I [Clostridiales bacterium]
MGYFNPIPDENKFIDKYLKWLADIIVVIVLAIFVIHFFCYQADVVGNSMADELNNSERILVNKLSYEIGTPKRFDVIVFKNDDNVVVKRIIALPGERVKIENSTIYINGVAIEDPYFDGNYESGNATTESEVGPNEYFVMGDNRNVSEDSRFSYVGNVKYEDILGKAWFVSAPFDRLGFID